MKICFVHMYHFIGVQVFSKGKQFKSVKSLKINNMQLPILQTNLQNICLDKYHFSLLDKLVEQYNNFGQIYYLQQFA